MPKEHNIDISFVISFHFLSEFFADGLYGVFCDISGQKLCSYENFLTEKDNRTHAKQYYEYFYRCAKREDFFDHVSHFVVGLEMVDVFLFEFFVGSWHGICGNSGK